MDLNHFKEKLENEKENLEKEIKTYKNNDPYLDTSRSPENYDDDISQMEGHDRTVATTADLERDLDEVEAALERINKGKFGKCENCGQEISLERLEVMPTARFCTNCQKQKG